MAERSFIFTSIESNGSFDREVTADDLRLMYSKIIGNGIYGDSATNLQITKPTGQDMILNVDIGFAWINGAFYINDAIKTITLSTASGLNPRIDRIVLRLSLTNRIITIEKLTGTAAGTPVAPALTRDGEVYELALADILVSRGVTYVQQASITDQRMNASLCGIVTGILENISTTNLFAQFTSAFDLWFSEVQLTLSGDIAGNLLTKIEDNTDDITTLTATVTSNKSTYDAYVLDQKQLFGIKLGGQRVWSGRKHMDYKDAIDTNFKKITDYCSWNESTKLVTFLKSGVYEVQIFTYIVDVGNNSAANIEYSTSIKTTKSLLSGKPALECSAPAMDGRNNEGYSSVTLTGLISVTAGDTAYVEVIPNHSAFYQQDGISQLVIFPKFLT